MGENKAAITIGKRTFITAVVILAVLMLSAGVLTQAIPAGSYDRVTVDGRDVVQQGTYHRIDRPDYPAWRWLIAPFEVLAGPDAATVIAIIVFLLCVAGAFALMEQSGVMQALLTKIVRRFHRRRHLLLAAVVFFFMLMGAVLGTFEENIALLPIMIALSYSLGWDALMGLGMSMLASCFGFTAAITNPFSIAITQRLSQLPLYSGTGLRIIIFLCYYGLTLLFLMRYARRIEKDPAKSLVWGEDAALREKYAAGAAALGSKTPDEQIKLDRALRIFAIFALLAAALVIVGYFVTALSDVQFPLIGLLFLLGGFFSAAAAGVPRKRQWKTFGASCGGIAPGIVLILMAMSVKFIISSGGIMDTILYYAAGAITKTSPYAAILLIYLLILVLELFVGSSSAKAFLVMPLIAPLSELVGVTRQTSVLAFCFGDGFSNILYPTNPVLLICLGLTVVTYPKWVKWTWKLQVCALLMACAFLFIGVALHYGP